ncbi:MAG: hypothetical protein AAGG07_11815 [Planctomycetota bacterium]
MPERLLRLYQRERVLNVNVNIIASAAVSTLILLVPVHLTQELLVLDVWWKKALFSAGVGAADLLLDVSIYFLLHWVANHWKPAKPRSEADLADQQKKKQPLLIDAGIVQMERAVLSPLYYIIALGGTFLLLKLHVPRVVAVAVSYGSGLLVTRTIHTFWMLRQADRAKPGAPRSTPQDA